MSSLPRALASLLAPLAPLVFLAIACNSGDSTSPLGSIGYTRGGAATPQSADASGPPSAASDAASPPPVAEPDGGPPSSPANDAGSLPGMDAGAAETDAQGPLGPLVVYASGYGPDINLYPLDASTGALGAPTTTQAFSDNPSFLAINREVTHLYAVDEDTAGQVGAYTIDPKTGALTFQNSVSSGGNGPPFLGLDRSESFLLVANYGDGTVSVVPVKADGSLSAPTSTLQVGMNAHMIIADPSNQFVFVPCLGADYVAQFLFDAKTGTLTPNAVPHVLAASGAGPRHLAFHPNGKFVYLVNETNSTLTLYTLDSTAGTLTEVQTVPTTPSGFSGTNTAAEVWVHPSGSWVLASNRGDDSIVVFAIDPTTGKVSSPTFTKSGGTTPRDFTIDPTGRFVFAANQDSGNVVPFTFDATTGALTAAGSPMSLTMASFVGVVRLAP